MSFDPSWVKVGAECVVYKYDHGNHRDPYRVTVSKVNAKSFKVEGYGDVEGELFKFSDGCSKEYGSRYSWWCYAVVPADDEFATKLFREQRIKRLDLKVYRALDDIKWERDRSDVAKIDAAIEALQSLAAALKAQP